MRIWGIILENIRQHFWAGTGLASMMDVITASVSSGPIIGSHNNYLTLLLERGILGLSLFLWIIYIFFRNTVRVNRLANTTDNQWTRALNLGLMGSMIVFMIHSAFDHIYGGFNFKVLFFLYIALTVSLGRLYEVREIGIGKRAKQ
jgi:O-antigen ligase